MPTLAINKKAKHDYTILETYEAGLVLTGAEVKSTKNGLIQLKSAYVTPKHRASSDNTELYLTNAHIPPYKQANLDTNYNPTRARKLLLKRKEISSIIGRISQKGLTLIPLSVYTKRSRIKVEIGLGRGKKLFDKRQELKKKDLDRETQRSLKW